MCAISPLEEEEEGGGKLREMGRDMQMPGLTCILQPRKNDQYTSVYRLNHQILSLKFPLACDPVVGIV